jgi:hypothetical protein
VARSTVANLADFLIGDWRIDRQILDAGGGQVGSFTGLGRFHPDTEVHGLLRYVEHGTMALDSHRGPAFRRLGYHVDGPVARVVFDDGRFFHDLDLRDGVYEVEHPCRADRYRGRFEVVSERTWRHDWTVTGPRKDHRVRTRLERLPDPS